MKKFLNFVFKLFKVQMVAIPYDREMYDAAKRITKQTAKMEGSGEFKRAQALRAMLNTNPGWTERDCALAIELAIR